LNQLLTLADVSRLTGQPVARLRHWCATGELACERVPTSWAIRERDLDQVQNAALRQAWRISHARALALAVPRRQAPIDLPALVEQRLDLPAGSAFARALSIDQQEYVIVVWPRRTGAIDGSGLIDLAEALGGELLTDGSAPPERRREPSRRASLVPQRSA
jgi:hypothetical protein